MPIHFEKDWKDLKATELMAAAGKPENGKKFVQQLHFQFMRELQDPGLQNTDPPEDYKMEEILLKCFEAKKKEEEAKKPESLMNCSGLVMFSLAEAMVQAAEQVFNAKIPLNPSGELFSFYYLINRDLRDFDFEDPKKMQFTKMVNWLYGDNAVGFEKSEYIPLIYIVNALLERLRNSGQPDGDEACCALEYLICLMKVVLALSLSSKNEP